MLAPGEETYKIQRSAYRPTTGRLERRLTTGLMRRFFRNEPMALDFGDGDIRPLCDRPADVHFAPPRFFTLMAILTNPSLKLGEAFMDGRWFVTRGSLADFLRIAVTGKGGRVEIEFIKEDYRHYCARKPAAYNRVVSIGMLEHVGRSKYGHYFNAIKDVLTENGLALVHSIVKHSPGRTNLWVDRYIFPGGYAPKISEVVDGIEKAGLKIKAVHYHAGENYIKTLKAWLQNLLAREDEIISLLIDEQDTRDAARKTRVAQSTYRMFIFYLSAVQLSFHPDYSDGGIGHFVVTR